MKDITLEELLEAGCHFGHQVTRSNPKARDYVYEAREGIQIIDLAKTKEGLDEALLYIRDAAREGKTMLVVGTKRQAQAIVKEEVERARKELKEKNPEYKDDIYYITTRWIGGILTNFSEISKNLKKLKDLTKKLQSNEEKREYTKKEIGLWDKERQRLESFYSGIESIERNPDILFIVDTHLEDLAVREGLNMSVPIVGITDTNANPEIIDYPIPANDDATGSIKLIVGYAIDAWIEGKKSQKSIRQPADKNSTDANAKVGKQKETEEAKKEKVKKVKKEGTKKETKKTVKKK